MRVQELRERRANLLAQAHELLDKTKHPVWDKSLEARYNALETEIASITEALDRHQAGLDREAESYWAQHGTGTSASPQARAVRSRPIHNYVPGVRAFQPHTLFADRADRGVINHPFSGVADLVASVVRSAREGVIDPRLNELRNASSTSSDPTSGGFAVPTQVELQVWDDIFSNSDILSLVDARKLLAGRHSYPTFDGMDRSVGGQGQLINEWVAENGSFTKQKATLRKVELEPKKCGALVGVSNELFADVTGFERQLIQMISSNARRVLEEMVVFGEGGRQPLGILNSPSLHAVTRTSSRYNDLLSCYSNNFNRSRAVWLVHSTVIPELFKLNFVGSTAASDLNAGVFVQRSDGVMTLLGRPVIVTDACNVATAQGDVIFVDLMSYVLGVRQGLVVLASEHVYFESDETAIRAVMRADGQGKYGEKLKQRDGATLNSWACTIAA